MSSKKRPRPEASPVPVIESPESVLQLLKRVYPALRVQDDLDGDDNDPPESVDPPPNGKRKHSRKSLVWKPGRSLLAVGINECTRLMGNIIFFSRLG